MDADTGYDPYNSAARWTWFDYATTNGGRYRRWVKVAPLAAPDEDCAWDTGSWPAHPELPPTAPPTTLPP